MFGNCYSLKKVDVSSFNTSKVTDISYMFSRCYSLGELESGEASWKLNLSGFNTANVTKINNMFDSCYSLSELDLSTFSTAKVSNLTDMFGTTGDGSAYGKTTSALTTIYATSAFEADPNIFVDPYEFGPASNAEVA